VIGPSSIHCVGRIPAKIRHFYRRRGRITVVNYLLRNIPDDVWRRVKALAALRGSTVRDLLLACLRELGQASSPEAPQRTAKPARRKRR
jgi:hypothetical protein